MHVEMQVYKGILDNVYDVAIKFMNPHDIDKMAESLKRFEEEIKISLACKDDNIVTCRGAWIDTVSQSVSRTISA